MRIEMVQEAAGLRSIFGPCPHRDLDVLDAAEGAAVLVDDLIQRSRRRLVEARQLRKAVMGVPLNISEGFARAVRADRDYKLRVARGEAEDAMSCSGRTTDPAASDASTSDRSTTGTSRS